MPIYDAIIVGSGFAGGVIANKLAKNGKKVLVLEKRNHIAGNMYDEKCPKTCILIQKYGPHIFHTNNEKVYDFLQSVGTDIFVDFRLKTCVTMNNIVTPIPFNFKTIDLFFESDKADAIKDELLKTYPNQSTVTIVTLLESDNILVKELALFLYENDYKPYTCKQWGIEPDELDVSVLKRIPFKLSYDEFLFFDKYQMLPKNGFTDFFEVMLSHENIDINLNCDANKLLKICDSYVKYTQQDEIVPIIYTGALDEFFDLEFGELPYRSLDFKYVYEDTQNAQNTSVMGYPQVDGYTRVTEYRNLMVNPPEINTTVLAYEYPQKYKANTDKIAYYPILTENSNELYQKYLNKSNLYKNLYPCGRLADFKYYNMDDIILRALEVFDNINF